MVLYSEGFESSKTLARKMVQMYRLCSEQLSQQDHYDFGMRAVKSVLVMAGALKRGNPDLSEDVVLIRALRDSNLPKFLADDTLLFKVREGSVYLFIYSFIYLFTIFAEDGTQREQRQQDTWYLLGLAPLVVEEVTVHNTGISLLLSTCVWVLLSPPIERRETRPTA